MRRKEKGVDVNNLEVFQTSQSPLGFFIFLTANPLIPIAVLCTLPTDEETKAKLPQFGFSTVAACVTVRWMDVRSQAAGHGSAG